MSYYYYHRNRFCNCPRCRSRALMGPAMLITIGVLFLLPSFGYADIGRTWPVILLVIGAVRLLNRTISAEGHVNPGFAPPMAVPGPFPPPPAPAGPVVTPQPQPPAGHLTAGTSEEARNG